MSHADAFIQAIIAEPDEIAHRLIFADWLEERSDPRGTFIRVQCRLAELPPGDDARTELEDEEYDLLNRYQNEWAAPFRGVAQSWRFTRGFIEHVTLESDRLLSHGNDLFRSHPVRYLTMLVPAGRGPAASESQLLSRIASLAIRCLSFRDRSLRALLESPHLNQVRTLDLAYCDLEWPDIEFLIPLPLTSRLRSLDLTSNRGLADRAGRALATSPSLSTLRELRLGGGNLTWRSAGDLLTSRNLRSLTTLELGSQYLFTHAPDPQTLFAGPESGDLLTRLKRLDLSATGLTPVWFHAIQQRLLSIESLGLTNNALGLESVQLLARSPQFANLTTLELGRNLLRADALQTLSDSSRLAGLRTLRLEQNAVRDTGVKALAASPHLTRLQVLDLRKNGIGGPGIHALVKSPNLAGLTSLDLSENYVGLPSIQSLGDSEYLDRLTHLALAGNHLEPEAVRILAASENLARLRSLDLSSNPLGPDGAWALASSPNLARLTTLHLQSTGMGDTGADALTASPHLQRLTRLEVTPNEGLTAEARTRLETRYGNARSLNEFRQART